jgi:hypothetical protein
MLATTVLSASTMIFPTPKKISEKGTAEIPINCRIIMGNETASKAADVLAKEMTQLFGGKVKKLTNGTGEIILRQRNLGLKPQGYKLLVKPGQIIIDGQDKDGIFYGVMSLLQVFESPRTKFNSQAGRITFPAIKITDWPDNPWRGYHFQLPNRYDPAMTRRAIRAMARWKYNYVVLEYGAKLKLKFNPSLNTADMVDPSEIKAVCAYARAYNVEPIPNYNSLGHMDRAYYSRKYTPHGGLDITNKDLYAKYLFPIYEEYLDAFGDVKYFHVGMDESFHLFKNLKKQGKNVPDLFAKHIIKVRNYFAKKGIRIIIWNDMLLARKDSNHDGAASGDKYDSWKTLEHVPKDVIINYWYYRNLNDYPVIDFFQKKGFEVWSSPWKRPRALTLAATRRNSPLLGTTWASVLGGIGIFSFFNSPDLAPALPLLAEYAWDNNAPTRDKLRVCGEEMLIRTLCTRSTRVQPAGKLKYITLDKNCSLKDYQTHIPPGTHKSCGIPFRVADKVYTVGSWERPKQVPYSELHNTSLVVWRDNLMPLKVDGVNRTRKSGDLILYTPKWKKARTATNKYGAEVAVVNNKVVQSEGYGSHSTKIPRNGYVLSAHLYGRWGGTKYNWLRARKVGSKLMLVNANQKAVAPYVLPVLKVRLPNGKEIGPTAVNGAGALRLFTPFDGSSTRVRSVTTDIEVAIQNDRVKQIGKGNTAIPLNGCVLSIRRNANRKWTKELKTLRVGDRITFIKPDGKEYSFTQTVVKRGRIKLGGQTSSLAILHATAGEAAIGALIGYYVLEHTNGTETRIPIRYGANIFAGKSLEYSGDFSDSHWAAFPRTIPPQRVVGAWALLWQKKSKELPIRGVRVELTQLGACAQLGVLAATVWQ